MQILDYDYSTRAFSALIFFSIAFKTKKGKMDFWLCGFYGCFLSMSNPTMAIAMIIAMAAAAMYVIRSVVVARFDVGVAVGVTGGASCTYMAVSAYDGQ